MGESALEWYFDNFIANDSSKMDKEEVNEELGDELFLSLLPDELLTLPESSQDETGSSTSLDYSSQNPTAAAELPGGSSMLEPGASPVRPTTPVMPVTQKPENIPQIQNVISTVNLGCCLDLDFIACKGWNVEYKPKAFKVLIMRLREPRTTAMISQSGSIVCTGAKSVEQSRLAARKYARIVQKLGFPASFLNFKIQNMVASCNTFPLSLEKLAYHKPCSYEPELFPGLHYNVMPGITAAIFSSGKICLTGAKKEVDVYKAFDIIYPILSCYRR